MVTCQLYSKEIKVPGRKETGSRQTRSCLKVSMALILRIVIALSQFGYILWLYPVGWTLRSVVCM